MDDRPPALSLELVQEFVIAGHSDLERVKAMLEVNPTLLNSAHDWGGGDFETALGGAAHVGSRSIAEYLLSRGAQMTIHAAASLDMLDLVKAMLAAQPEAENSPGAHGIPLLRHAVAGGADSVVEYLESLGRSTIEGLHA